MTEFSENAPLAKPVFARTYSRQKTDGSRETWDEVCDRTIRGLAEIGRFTEEEREICDRMQRQLKTLSSGRWLWLGGTDWVQHPDNYYGAYNCSGTEIVDWEAFELLMNLAAQGCGTGAIVEPRCIDKLPAIVNRLEIEVIGSPGDKPKEARQELTSVQQIFKGCFYMIVGDSRQGWTSSYRFLLETASQLGFGDNGVAKIRVDLSHVRAKGERLKGFGGVANPIKLPEMYPRCAAVLNKAVGRKLNSVECCLLIGEAAITIVAGSIRRCIAKGSKVTTIDGIKPIEAVRIGDLVLTSSGEYRPVLNRFVQGVQDVVEIRTPATSISCTANHRVAVYDGLRSYKWKYAGDLQKGDRLISVPHKKGIESTETDFAWLIGLYIGDGHADTESCKRRKGGGGQVTFALPKTRIEGELGKKCLRILYKLGYEPRIGFKEEGDSAWINVYRKDLAVKLSEYKKPWGVPVIPEIVWNGTPEIRAAFLAGLCDSDGTPSRNVLLNSTKLEFLREVQKLALSLGIATTLHERKPKRLANREKIYEGCHWIHIRGLQSQAIAVSLINQFTTRGDLSLKLGKKNGLSLPHEFVQEVIESGWRATTIRRTTSIIGHGKNVGAFRDANFDTLLAEDVVNPHWLPMEVQFVAPSGEAETFDIEVEGDHEFIANGLLVHNSAGIRQGSNKDDDFAESKMNLWRQTESGDWIVDPEKDVLRMANHTRVYHTKPSLEETIEAVRKQYYSGEGAIQWAGEAVARANADVLRSPEEKHQFLLLYYPESAAPAEFLSQQCKKYLGYRPDEKELTHRLSRYSLNPCGK